MLDMRPRGVGGSSGGGAPFDATYITQTPNVTLTNEQALSLLATGMLKNTTATGILSIGVPTVDFASAAQGALADTSLQPGDIGVTVQAYDLTLDALAAYNTNGLLTQTAVDTFAGRSIAVGAGGFLSVADGNGVAGNPTLDLADAELLALAGLTSAADKLPYFTGLGTAALTDFTAFARTILDDANQGAVQTTLGLVIGTNVQAWDADLDTLAGLSKADSNFIVGDGVAWVVESGATARTSLGLGTIATQNANNVTISGGSIVGITDLAIADGGTGQGTAQAAINALSGVAGATVGHVLTKSVGGDAIWAASAGGSGSPGGSDTQVQFNDGGAFGGDSGLVFNKTTDTLTLAGPQVIDIPADSLPLKIQGHSTQTNNILEYRKDGQTIPNAYITPDGTFFSKLNPTINGTVFTGLSVHAPWGGGDARSRIDLQYDNGGSGTARLKCSTYDGGGRFQLQLTDGSTVKEFNFGYSNLVWSIDIFRIVAGSGVSAKHSIGSSSVDAFAMGYFNSGSGTAFFDFLAGWADRLEFRIDGSSKAGQFSNGRWSFGGSITPLAQVHIEQQSTTAAIPTLRLKQADLSEEFIRFDTTVGAGNAIDTAALGAYYGKVRVYVEGVGAKWLALYD